MKVIIVFARGFCPHYLRSLVGGELEILKVNLRCHLLTVFARLQVAQDFSCLLSAILLSLQTANKDGAGGGFAVGETYWRWR